MSFEDACFQVFLKRMELPLNSLGRIIATEQAPYLHPVTRLINPPCILLEYEKTEGNTDAFLAELASLLNHNVSHVRSQWEEKIAFMQNDLLSKDNTFILNLGVLIQDKAGERIFQQSPDLISPQHFGLPIVDASLPPKNESPINPIKPLIKTKRKRRISLYVFIIIILAACGVGAWYFADPESFNEQLAKIMPQELPSAPTDSTSSKDSIVAIAQVENPDIDTAAADSMLVNETEIPANTTGPQFYIVSNVFRYKEYADNHVAELKKKGYDARIQGTTPEGLFRVVFGSYPSETEAKEALSKIKVHCPAAWMFAE